MIYADPKGAFANGSCAGGAAIRWKDTDEQSHWQEVFLAYQRKVISCNETWWGQPQSATPAEVLRTKLGIAAGKKVVLFAGQVDGDVQRFLFAPQYPSNLEAFRAFCRVVRCRNDLFVLGKHHPFSSTDPSEYRRVVDGIGVWVDDVPISDCWPIVDRVAAVNSSVLSEAALRGIPALAMGTTLVSGRGIFHELSATDPSTTVEQWLDDQHSPEWRQRWLEWGAWMFSRHLFALQDPLVNLGALGPKNLAERLAGWATRSETDYASVARGALTAPALLRQWQDAIRQLDAILHSRTWRLASKFHRIADNVLRKCGKTGGS
jgi:hypothetical protein